MASLTLSGFDALLIALHNLPTLTGAACEGSAHSLLGCVRNLKNFVTVLRTVVARLSPTRNNFFLRTVLVSQSGLGTVSFLRNLAEMWYLVVLA